MGGVERTWNTLGFDHPALTFQPTIGGPPEEGGDTLEVEGTFTVEALPRLELEQEMQ